MTDAEELAEIAELIVTWSGVVLGAFALLMAVLTVLFVAAGFFGIRELRSIRKTGNEAREQLRQQRTVAREVMADTEKAITSSEELHAKAIAMQDRAQDAVTTAEAQTEQVRLLSARLEKQIHDLDQRMNTMVEVSYLFNQGEEAYREGQYDKAVEFLRRTLQLQPKNARVRYRLGRALTALGRDDEAERELTTALADGHDPEHGERGLAWLFRHADPALADEHATRALDAAQSAANLNCAGLLRRDQQDYAGAREAHEKAHELEPNTIITSFYLALLAAEQGKTTRARQWSAEAVSMLDVERRARIVNIWAPVIRWSDLVLRDELDAADRYAAEAAETSPSRRRADEVGEHMRFLLRALAHADLEDRYLSPLESRWRLRRRR